MRATIVVLTCLMFIAGGCATQRPVTDVMASGDRALSRGDYAGAVAEFEEVTNRYPGDWRAQYKLGLALIELGDYTPARRALEIAHTRRPQENAIVEALAEAMFRQGNHEQLYAFLQQRVDKTQSVDSCLRLARYCIAIDDPDSAQHAIDLAMEWDGGRTAEPFIVAAELAQHVGDEARAMQLLQSGYEVNPHDRRIGQRLRALGMVPGPTMPR
ncbi:MAG: tetratricopeptide repeat protein [Phycisphaerales bacterium]|nr:tetratricopeptide repeat protein [Phycisphaerae bacterium]NNF42355.1 tetratricopeptide repeat protein [Phycisphaerales bacterium]NNM27099.1 tetratricopeptide repeat protein [Phycisphaerales bacterium]